MENNKETTKYIINAGTYESLKYMMIDFMDDTPDINGSCIARKCDINALIDEIDKTRVKTM
ncbi:hypothetical protein [Apilactobacillus micheneri]|uniref:hypothetical protein n=1 Tax=Apilactobacillus micheneri TaxID=1899430 RepID=UPI000D03C024|nr:hypothetical protein [Apilactobacillus micheneri]TPR37673.1 hypothetical protein DY116_00155 [Apilactobacillus micheneri]